MFFNKIYTKVALIAVATVVMFPTLSTAQNNGYSSDAKRPRLVVVINAPQIRHDYLYKYAHNFSDKGINRMIGEGVSYSNARYNYMFTQSSPGISTIMTGTQPSQHGVIGDGWINFTTNQKIEAAIDYTQKGIGCNEEEGCYSPKNLLVSTVGDEIKRHYPKSKVISISMEPESAVFSSGKIGDAAYWLDERYGGWVTSSYYMDKLPEWVEGYNATQTKVDYANRKWTISKPYDAYLYKECNKISVDNSNKISFDTIFKAKNSAQFSILKETPMGNSYLTDFAVQTIANEKLGDDDNNPDLLVVNYGVIKHITQSYGIESMDLEDAIYQLDNDIAALLSFLDEEVGKENYVAVFTSAHGTSNNITGERETSGRFNATQFRVLMGGFMNTQFGNGEWISEYRNRQLYINRRLAFEKGISITDIQSRVATFALQFNGVAQTITATALQNNYYGKSIMQKIQNSFFPKHSGDVIINLLPGWIEIDGQEMAGSVMSASGSPYEYDSHVPLVWCGAKFVGKTVTRNVDMSDIAPTIAELLHIPHPNASEGTQLTEIITELN